MFYFRIYDFLSITKSILQRIMLANEDHPSIKLNQTYNYYITLIREYIEKLANYYLNLLYEINLLKVELFQTVGP